MGYSTVFSERQRSIKATWYCLKGFVKDIWHEIENRWPTFLKCMAMKETCNARFICFKHIKYFDQTFVK